MGNYIAHELRPLVARLSARYLGVRIVEADMSQCHDGSWQQNIRYQAPIETLRRYGLLTDEMLRDRRCSGATSLGEGFYLRQALDDESRPGCVDLSIWTGEFPRERPRMALKDAQRVLKRIAKAAGRESRGRDEKSW